MLAGLVAFASCGIGCNSCKRLCNEACDFFSNLFEPIVSNQLDIVYNISEDEDVCLVEAGIHITTHNKIVHSDYDESGEMDSKPLRRSGFSYIRTIDLNTPLTTSDVQDAINKGKIGFVFTVCKRDVTCVNHYGGEYSIYSLSAEGMKALTENSSQKVTANSTGDKVTITIDKHDMERTFKCIQCCR